MEQVFHEPDFPVVALAPEDSARKKRELLHAAMPGVTIVNDAESAQKALEVLFVHKERYHACDTEVIDINLNEVGPVGHGIVICATLFIGPDVDFGNGPRLFIDNLDASEGVLNLFKRYFEDASIKKVWHNYGFDRHVLFNHGIDVQVLHVYSTSTATRILIDFEGFGGDTMHMARLWDASRAGRGEYSLESLSADVLEGRIQKRVSSFLLLFYRNECR